MSTVGLVILIIFVFIFRFSRSLDTSVISGSLALSGIAVILVAFYYHHKFSNLEKILFRIDRQPVLSAAMAIEGVPYSSQGRLVPTDTMVAPISGKKCIYYHVIKERYESRGKHSEWVMRENVMAYKPFYVEDKSGRLRVDMVNMDHDFSKVVLPATNKDLLNPKNSEIDATPMFVHREFKKDVRFAFDEKWRESEYILEPYQSVFVYGMVFKEGSEKVLREAPDCPLIVSRKTKDEYVDEFFKGPSIWYFSSLLIAIGFIMFMLGISRGYQHLFIPGVILGSSLITIHAMFKSYNRLVLLKERANNSSSEIEVQLKKRSQLIPPLVGVVKAYAKHEKEVNRLIVEIRSDLTFFPLEEKRNEALIAILEAYPKLKADENFRSLMTSLQDIEESIAQTREFYNRSVLKYNILCQQFPTNIVATLTDMRPRRFINRYTID